MRILHAIYDDVRNPWCGGGGAVRAFEINRRLARRHDVTLLTGNFPGAKPVEEREGMRIVRVGTDRSHALSRLTYTLLAPRRIGRMGFDILVHDFSAYAPFWLPPAVRTRSILLLHHTMSAHALKMHPAIGLLSWISELLMVRRYGQIITVSRGAAAQLRRRLGPATSVQTVHNGVDIPPLPRNEREGDYLLYLGRFDIYGKGLDILLQAFARVARDFPEHRLVLAGRATPDRVRRVESLSVSAGAAGQVAVLGPVSEEVKRELLEACLFVCAPSRYEGWCIVAIEAGAAAKAVIGSRIPGLVDAVREGETGILVPPENAERLAGAMRRLLQDQGYRRRLGRAGRRRAERFSWDRVAGDQERFYEQVLSRLKKRDASHV